MLTRRGGTALGVLVACVLVAVTFFAVRDALRSADNALRLSEATLSIGDAAGTPVQLPYRWTPFERQTGLHRFDFEFDFDASRRGGRDLSLHVPVYEPYANVYLNGLKIFDSTTSSDWPGPLSNATALMLLPAERLLGGRNTLRIDLQAEERKVAIPFAGGLSDVYVGWLDELRPIYYWRSFFNHDLKIILFGAQIMLACFALVLFLRKPSDTAFGWMSMVLFLSLAYGAGPIAQILPDYRLIIVYTFLMSPVVGLALVGLSGAITGSAARIPLWLLAGMFVFLAALPQLFDRPVVDLTFHFSLPVTIALFFTSFVILARGVVRNRSLDVVLTLSGVFILFVGAVHDVGVWRGWIEHGLMLAQVSRIITLVGFAAMIFRRYTSMSDALDNAADELRARLTEKERELADLYEEQKRKDAARLLQEERARMTRDLHDGVAGHLVAITALSESDKDLRDNIKASARAALGELRLVLDTLEVEEADLHYYLGVFRGRCVEPLEALGYDVTWSMTRLPELGTIPQEAAFNIIRILQEAVTNAVRHGASGRLDIRGEAIAPDTIRFVVRNDLSPQDPTESTGGLGLRNARERAHSLDGFASFEVRDGQAEFTLTMPVRTMADTGVQARRETDPAVCRARR